MDNQLEVMLEDKALSYGRERYLKSLKTSTDRKTPLDRTDLQSLLKNALPLVSAVIRERLSVDPKGRHPQAYQVLKQLDPDLVALVSLSASCWIISKEKPLASVCHGIGRGIDDELWAAEQQARVKAEEARRLEEQRKAVQAAKSNAISSATAAPSTYMIFP